ncbi:hypothetical protein [Paraferrimonas sp. SM1919]|uniref:hypothetical protein n=1 Tax=Paraferrimonas sp. SM1919 TaxID=2662263 RepID=UPI0013D872AD|nr:hypothetical protein [Paraferrimonas sp. SM1919]
MGVIELMVFLLLWLMPLVLIGRSKKTQGVEKVGWMLAMVFVSWFAWVLYMFVAPIYIPKSETSSSN